MKWEYKAVRLVRPIESEKGIDLTNALCELGEKEWELVQCDLYHDLFIFKRPKHETQKLIDQDERAIEGIKLYEAGKNA